MTALARHPNGVTLSPGGRAWKPAPRTAKPATEQPAPEVPPSPTRLHLPFGTSRVQRIAEAPEALILAALTVASRGATRHFHNAHPDLGDPISPRALWAELTGSINGYSPQVTAALVSRLDALVARGLAVRGILRSAGTTRPVYWPAQEAHT